MEVHCLASFGHQYFGGRDFQHWRGTRNSETRYSDILLTGPSGAGPEIQTFLLAPTSGAGPEFRKFLLAVTSGEGPEFQKFLLAPTPGAVPEIQKFLLAGTYDHIQP